MPKPFSVKFRPTRVFFPRPSKSRQITCDMSTPPCMMKSSTSHPRSFFGSAVTTADRFCQHFSIARATLYSPPPSHTWNERALRTRPKPGSKRSITSPNDTQSHFVSAAVLIFSSAMVGSPSSLRGQVGLDGLHELHGGAHLVLDPLVVLRVEQLLRDEIAADAAGDDARTEPGTKRRFRRFHAAGRHDARPRHRGHHALHEIGAADRGAGEHLHDLAPQLLGEADLARRAAAG